MSKVFTTAQARDKLTAMGFTQQPNSGEWKHAEGRTGRLEWIPDYSNDDGRSGVRYYLRLRTGQTVDVLNAE
jgi:hypothetical protein